jgi:hypothetical protein
MKDEFSKWWCSGSKSAQSMILDNNEHENNNVIYHSVID